MIVHSVYSYDYICALYQVPCTNTQANRHFSMPRKAHKPSITSLAPATHITVFFLNLSNEIIYHILLFEERSYSCI